MENTLNDKTARRVDEYLKGVKELRIFQGPKIEGSLEYYAQQYESIATWKNLLFRLTGTLVILLSVSLPIFAAFGNVPHKELWVSVIAAAIALCSGLNSFFRWDEGWRGCMEARRKLLQLRDQWEYKIERAKTYPDADKGFQIAKEATATLVNSAHEIILSETKQYLEAQRFPDAGGTRER